MHRTDETMTWFLSRSFVVVAFCCESTVIYSFFPRVKHSLHAMISYSLAIISVFWHRSKHVQKHYFLMWLCSRSMAIVDISLARARNVLFCEFSTLLQQHISTFFSRLEIEKKKPKQDKKQHQLCLLCKVEYHENEKSSSTKRIYDADAVMSGAASFHLWFSFRYVQSELCQIHFVHRFYIGAFGRSQCLGI